MKRKNVLRMVVLISIAMFVLIPLLSSPVAAVVNYNAGTGTTTNPTPPAVQTVVFAMSAPFATPPGAIPPLIVNFNWNFADTFPSPGGKGSNHMCTLTVTQTSPAGPPPVSATTGMTYIGANSRTTSGWLTTTSPFTPPQQGSSITFTIRVDMYVDDNSNPLTSLTGFGTTTVNIW